MSLIPVDIYAQNILDHYKNPRNFGKLNDANISQEETNASCGDKLKVDLNFKGEKIIDLKFSGQGCAISIASMSILSEHIISKTKKQILDLNFIDIKKLLGVPISERRKKCAMIGLVAVQIAVDKYKVKK